VKGLHFVVVRVGTTPRFKNINFGERDREGEREREKREEIRDKKQERREKREEKGEKREREREGICKMCRCTM
jgi:hypothetical protein